MKKLFTFLALIVITTINAQAPQGFNYQATVRNAAGDLIINQNVTFKFNIMLNTSTSLPVFSETHYVPTDDLGQVNLTVGQGTATIGSFAGINWGGGTYYLGIELSTGANFVAMGTTQLLSVPYALYANTAGSTSSNNTGLISPTITTNPVANIIGITATFSASISNVNINQLKPRAGFVYSLNPNPVNENYPFNGSNDLGVNLSSNTFTFDSAVQGFTFSPNTLYYVRAFVVTENNIIFYGNEVTFTTEYENTPLPSVTIGSQIWSTTNLDVTTYRDGTPIPEVTDPTQWANLTTGAWCYYNNDSANGTTYGKLYNWYAVAGIHDNDPNTPNKILAPIGWHVPSNTEWTTLSNYLGGESVAGGKMKETSSSQTDLYSWYYDSAATNLSGFSAKPASWRYTENSATVFGGNYPIKMSAFWWASTEFGSGMASLRNIQASSNSLNMQVLSHIKSNGLSLRLVKD